MGITSLGDSFSLVQAKELFDFASGTLGLQCHTANESQLI